MLGGLSGYGLQSTLRSLAGEGIAALDGGWAPGGVALQDTQAPALLGAGSPLTSAVLRGITARAHGSDLPLTSLPQVGKHRDRLGLPSPPELSPWKSDPAITAVLSGELERGRGKGEDAAFPDAVCVWTAQRRETGWSSFLGQECSQESGDFALEQGKADPQGGVDPSSLERQ